MIATSSAWEYSKRAPGNWPATGLCRFRSVMETAAETLTASKDGCRALSESAANPLHTLAASRTVTFDTVAPAYATLLRDALAHADVGLCGYATAVSVSRDIDTDFHVTANAIVLHESTFSSPAMVRLHLRHAIELTLWLQRCSAELDDVGSVAVALLSALATTKFYLQMLTAERLHIATRIPQWLRGSASSREADRLHTLASLLAVLLPLQGARVRPELPIEQAIQLAAHYWPVALPTEFILTQQGDERLLIDPATGLNKYGCSPRPRPDAITFSSCTASSVSEFAYREAELLRQRLMQTLPHGTLAAQYEREMETVRAALKELLGLDPRTAVILSSSGTDAELYPLVLLRPSDTHTLINIVVAPDEVGGGTALAAAGRHFGKRTPLGAAVRQGDPIADLKAVEVISIPIRDGDGARLSEDELKERVSDAVRDAAQRADTVIVHLVDNSKTGVVAPPVDCAIALKTRFGDKVTVLVDACQFRLERTNLQRYLAHGFWVLITGSKFFTGPPLGGALLIPDFRSSGHGAPFARGFADYFTRGEVPRDLQGRAQNLSSAVNLGLLFRWTGALTEMRAFYTVPSERRTEILQTFRSQLVDSIRANADVRLLDCPVPHRWDDADTSLWDALATIFSFAVRDPRPDRSGTWMPLAELKKIYYLLNRDCSSHLPESAADGERQLAAQKCHIGQPVTIARASQTGMTSALRIACGARLVYGITHDNGLGKTPAERFQRELTDAQSVLKKVSLILKYWDSLCREEGFNEAASVPTELEAAG